MAEKIGFLALLILFVNILLPSGLDYYKENVKANKMLTLSNEFHQLLAAEGDINSPRVNHVVNDLNNKGVTISFYNESGSRISNASTGDKVKTTYEYDGYKLSNSTILMRR